jgi:hypothetical protein
MSGRTARWIGGFGAVGLGALALDFFPPLGLVEMVAAIGVLVTHRREAALAALIPTVLILYAAVRVVVDVSGLENLIMWPVAVGSGLTSVAFICGGTIPDYGAPFPFGVRPRNPGVISLAKGRMTERFGRPGFSIGPLVRSRSRPQPAHDRR